MTLAEFIRGELGKRLNKAGCLVVYDGEKRYRDQCLALADGKVRVVDTSESSIESREAALLALREVGQSNTASAGVLIYVPAKRPTNEEEKQGDPFALYAECGAVFPQDDGDEYLSLCLRARPDRATEIRRIFDNSPAGPPFAVIDAIGSGLNWPQLRALLKVESAREILTALLVPNEAQTSALKEQEGWVTEARDFLQATLGLSLKTRGKTWRVLAEELWRYLLFSEFVFDLPVVLPVALRGVPHAPIEARPIVEDVCDRLRTDPKSSATYIKQAEEIEDQLALRDHCHGIDDLGERDTFPFEERTFLRNAIKGIVTGDTDATRRVLARHRGSVWLARGESRVQWDLIRAGLGLVEACDDFERQLPDQARSQAELIDFYLLSLREADRLQREFEQATGDIHGEHDLISVVIDQARARYRRLAEKVQGLFVKHLETGGWPPAGRLANTEVFDRLVADRLKESGRRLAYFKVDALRYELGVVLERLLAEDGPVELKAACAQLPTITLVGMASLLPGASSGLTLSQEKDDLVPMLAGVPVSNVSQRMNVLAKRYGDRFVEMPLKDFVRGKPKIAETVDLLVLRSTEIDSQLESNPESTLRLIPDTLKSIRVAVNKLRGIGFHEVIIATDHGFFLNAQAEAGDVCIKPQGAWPINAHDRMMLGSGPADGHSLVVSAEKVGIRGDFAQVALPRSMAPYRAGHLYFHGGASLAEAIVPVLLVRLETTAQPVPGKVIVAVQYKNGTKRVTTRLPVIEVELRTDELFWQDLSLEVLLEAQDSKGNVVGEPRPGGDVNPATRTVTLRPNQRLQIALRLDEEFRGKFRVLALNPKTLALASKDSVLELETDYTE